MLPPDFPDWPAKYLGARFREDGETFGGGLSCWGLVRLVIGEQSGLWLPGHDGRRWAKGDAQSISDLFRAASRSWVKVDATDARPLDVVLLYCNGLTNHVGVVAHRTWMIHIERSCLSVIERWDQWPEGLHGIYRHVALT